MKTVIYTTVAILLYAGIQMLAVGMESIDQYKNRLECGVSYTLSE